MLEYTLRPILLAVIFCVRQSNKEESCEFMIEFIGKVVTVTIDRPLGSSHPEHNFIYPVNYGYLEGTKAGDGAPIDVYVLGVFEPLNTYTGVVIGVISRKDDVEDKLVVAKTLNQYDKDQIKALTEFQERFFEVDVFTYDYLRQSIRNTVRGVIRREDKILMLEETYNGETYYYLPGGGIEFLESGRDALIREIKEELKSEVVGFNLLETVSNIFEISGIKAHEIAQVYNVILKDVSTLKDGQPMKADMIESTQRWIEISELKKGEMNLYPKDLINLLY